MEDLSLATLNERLAKEITDITLDINYLRGQLGNVDEELAKIKDIGTFILDPTSEGPVDKDILVTYISLLTTFKKDVKKATKVFEKFDSSASDVHSIFAQIPNISKQST